MSAVVNSERIFVTGYKLDTAEDFDICIHGLRKSMQLTLDVLALNGHYEDKHITHPGKSTEDASFMNVVLGELRLIRNNTFFNKPVEEEEVVKKTTRRKKTKQVKISFEE